MKRALPLVFLSSSLLGCPTQVVSTDASLEDASVVDAATPDAAVPPRDWPFVEPPRSTEPEPGIARDIIEIESAAAPNNPRGSIATPDEFNRARFVRFHASSGAAPSAIVIAMPGILGGAGSFEFLARALVRRSLTETQGPIEVWAIDRRSNFLEDTRGVDAAEAMRNPEVARGYYNGRETIGGQAFAGFIAQRDMLFASEWGVATHFADLRAVIDRVPAPLQKTHVFLLGHSLGASMAETFGAWEFEDGTRGASLVAGIVLIDGSQGETAMGESVFRMGGSAGLMPSSGIDTIRESAPAIALPLLGVGVYVQAEILAMSALYEPDEVRTTDTARNRVFGTLLGLNPNALPPMTNEAVFGFGFDESSNGLSFAAVSMGTSTGGPLESYESLFGTTLMRPADRMSTYAWIDAADVTPREATPLANLAHSWFDGRTNFAEWYFPARLANDLAACGGLALSASAWQAEFGLRCRRGAEMDAPVLAIASALRGPDDYDASRLRGAPIGAGRPNAGLARTDAAAYRVVNAAGFTHIDPLSGEDFVGNPVPEAVLSFVRVNAGAGTVAPLTF